MKLLYITTKLSGAGGMQRVIVDKANTFSAMGYDVSILCTNTDDELIIYDLLPAVKYSSIKPSKGIFYFSSYKKLLKRQIDSFNPDVIIMCDNGLKSFLLPFIAGKKHTLVYEMHGSRYIWNDIIKFVIIRKAAYSFMNFAAAKFDSFVVLSSSAVNEWKGSNVQVIPNYLWFSPGAKSNLTSKIVVAVGRHAPEKGYDRLLAAWKTILATCPDWELHIYGDDNPDYNVKKMAIGLGLHDSVKFFEPVKNIQDVYAAASVCLMASRSEGFGMALLEAMACGVPCVAFNCPVGPADIIENGYNGFIIQDGNIPAFSEGVIKIMSEDLLRNTIGSNAIVTASQYNKEMILQKWETLFKSLPNP